MLLRFLRNELGWPVASNDFEELTFDYTPEELGIDAASAAKIQEIKRLRPLAIAQPWGIFFVKFEPKHLPVVALRRILSRVVLKKRASANHADRAAWQPDDLLFISTFGDDAHRHLSFAHFSQDSNRTELPTLKVLGWDDQDTVLHMDDVAVTLARQLSWPSDKATADEWRDQWRAAFTVGHREVITTSRVLAVRLAEVARAIRSRLLEVLRIEADHGPVKTLMRAFQAALIHDLDDAGFADTYAQTIAYGLLSARVSNPTIRTADRLSAQVPITNPFLKELLETFLQIGGRNGEAGGARLDFDELGVSRVVELLDAANMAAVVRDFGDRNPDEDPVIHFYELFLKEYDPKEKLRRGVFYTPRPVVSYIVRSVHELLCTEFGLEDGLADTITWGELAKRRKDIAIPPGVDASQMFVQILDPATGTGTFLIEVVDLIHRRLQERWRAEGHGEDEIAELWNDYVPKYLLPRLHGYELLMAPYAIAHLKMGLKLYETGYRFGSDERVRIYLTDSLEPAKDFSSKFVFEIPALAHEGTAVNAVKAHQRFTVVIANPPYSGVSSNMSEAAQHLVDPYRLIDGQPLNERKVWLQDDYVKFFGLAQKTIDRSGLGVLGVITNHAYLDNPTFRGMRQSLISTFPLIRVLDLHGNANKKERAPDGDHDENVFDIQQGVAIYVGASGQNQLAHDKSIRHAGIWGSRPVKYAWLLNHSAANTPFAVLAPDSPYYFFVPRDETGRAEYSKYLSLVEIFPESVSGIVTSRDAFVIDESPTKLRNRILEYIDPSFSDGEVTAKFSLSENYAWRVGASRRKLRADGFDPARIRPILYRPFDKRHIYYHPAVVWRTRGKFMDSLAHKGNIALISVRQVAEGVFNHAFVADCLIEGRVTVSNKGIAFCWPLFVSTTSTDGQEDLFANWSVNCNATLLGSLSSSIGLTFVSDQVKSSPKSFGPLDVLGYCYAILHSPRYRKRYAEFLKIDFPRIPFTGNQTLFRGLSHLGQDLIHLHLGQSPTPSQPTVMFVGPKRPEVGRVGWSEDTGWLDVPATKKGQPLKRGTVGFRGISEEVWNFHLGGYQVCEKWLKDRRGYKLTQADIAHYQEIVSAIGETRRIMADIDEAINTHGGWPTAFTNLVKSP
jgi:hypothetical protein